MRPRPEHELDTRPFDPEGVNTRLVEVYGVRCRDLGRLFDVRGNRLLHEHRAADKAEQERKARAKSFRESMKAGRKVACDSD
eukprot:1084688-Pleurochrysis_carterae.AAC.2